MIKEYLLYTYKIIYIYNMLKEGIERLMGNYRYIFKQQEFYNKCIIKNILRKSVAVTILPFFLLVTSVNAFAMPGFSRNNGFNPLTNSDSESSSPSISSSSMFRNMCRRGNPCPYLTVGCIIGGVLGTVAGVLFSNMFTFPHSSERVGAVVTGTIGGCFVGFCAGLGIYYCSKRSSCVHENPTPEDGIPFYITLGDNTREANLCECSGSCECPLLAPSQRPFGSHQTDSHRGSGNRTSSCFLPGYNRDGQTSSLLGMQCILASSSEHVLMNLKALTLKAHEYSQESMGNMEDNYFPLQKKWLSGPSRGFISTFKNYKPSFISYRVFASMDNYQSNLEFKVRSGSAGVVTELFPGISVGLAYNRHTDTRKEYGGIQLNTGSGIVQSRSKTEALSAVVALNPETKGFTGHIASYYGWGKMQNNRSVTHGYSETTSKGKPDMSLTGLVGQVGYNIPIAKSVTLTPYVEYMYTMVKWDAYQELSGILPCEISGNKEQIIEKSIGLRSHWEVTSGSQLQTWVAGISGSHKKSGLHSRPLATSMPSYKAAVPVNKKQYTRTEVGLSYVVNITDMLEIGCNGILRFKQAKKIDSQYLALQAQYRY
ncbi:autotransporter domain-containing protein [Lawsonia intracellularis]|nr:autotransporter domain-containing protein [Lawsonia intracellularis]